MSVSEELYQELMTAIIIQAISDYFEYRYKAENAVDAWEKHHAEREMIKIEEFFYSERFMLYSDLDGRELLSAIKRIPPKKTKRGLGMFKHGRCKVDQDGNRLAKQ